MFKHFRKLNFKSDNYLALRENCLIEYRKYQKDFWDLSNHEMFKVIFKNSKNTWYIYIYIYIYVHPNALFYLKTNLPGLQDVFKH